MFEPSAGAIITGASPGHRLLNAGAAAGGRDRGGAAERLEAAVVAAAAEGTVRKDGLVPDLPGGAVVSKVQPAIDHHATAHSGAERDA